MAVSKRAVEQISLLDSVHAPRPRRRGVRTSDLPPMPRIGPTFVSAYHAKVAYVRSCDSSALHKVAPFCHTLSRVPVGGHLIHVTIFNSSFVRTSVFATSLHRVLRGHFKKYKINFIAVASVADKCHPAMHRSFKK